MLDAWSAMGMGSPCLWSGAVPLFAAAGRTAFNACSHYAPKARPLTNSQRRGFATDVTTEHRYRRVGVVLSL